MDEDGIGAAGSERERSDHRKRSGKRRLAAAGAPVVVGGDALRGSGRGQDVDVGVGQRAGQAKISEAGADAAHDQRAGIATHADAGGDDVTGVGKIGEGGEVGEAGAVF